ncbi:hypothetical protein K9B35_04840 [Sphingomonas sp. R647]|uniref:hypothetical protein n=1 Tax=Sphingomonas sp. R647 TaxID=2875233 RepID=UPI001CD64EFF|nr:hypothetical protein [Sphingomonas sp. R647]MCA1197284.1 hypothetical protein [Sphingomonas sp. R647]
MLLLATGNHAQSANQLAPPSIAPPVVRCDSAVAGSERTVPPVLPLISGAQGGVFLNRPTFFERRRTDASATLPAGVTASGEYGRASTDVLAGSTDRLTFSIIAQF